MNSKILFIAAFPVFSVSYGISNAETRYSEVDCVALGEIGEGCTQCFDGGTKAVGVKFTPDMTFSAGDQSKVIFQEENQERFIFETLSENTRWSYSSDLIGYPSSWLWYTASDGNTRYGMIEAGETVRLYATKTDAGIILEEIKNSFSSASEYEARLKFIVAYRNFLGPGQAGDLRLFKSCIFYSAGK